MKSLTILITLFNFTTIKIKIPDYTHWTVLFHYYSNGISGYAHFAVLLRYYAMKSMAKLTMLFYFPNIKMTCFMSLLLKGNLWLYWLHFFTSLILKWIFWLRWLHSFTSLLFKRGVWLHSTHCFTSLLLKWNLWLRWLRCFTSLLLKWSLWLCWIYIFSSLLLTKLFNFTTIIMKIQEYAHYTASLHYF